MPTTAGFSTKIKLDLPTDEQVALDLDELVRLALKKFVHGASSRIPKFSGQARGSLLNLADDIGARLKGGPPAKSVGRPIPLGQSFSSGREKSFYSIKPIGRGSIVEFNWSTSVEYFGRWNREWRAAEEGGLAFFNELDRLIDDKPPGF